MDLMKKLTAVVVAVAMMTSSANVLNAAECKACCEETCGYTDCCNAFSVSPVLAFGAIALLAVIAITVQNNHNVCCKDSNHASP